MKTIRLLFILGVIAMAANARAQYVLILRFGQMDPFVGKLFEIRVTEIGSGKEVGRKTVSAIESPAFSMELYVLLQSRSYNVDFYVDVNGNGHYDPPPADKAWRRVVNNATMNTAINFVPDITYTNITFPDPFPYSTYDAVWGGKWMNQTFGSTDSIQASINLRCDSIFGNFMTKGVFGNPAPLIINYANALPPDSVPPSDTIRFSPAPFTGDVYTVNGELHGNLTLATFGLHFIGTLGAKQILALDTVIVGGTVLAHGYFYVRELSINSTSPKLSIDLLSNVGTTCFNGTDGSLQANAEGGTPGYSYLWSTGDTTAQLSNIASGDYTLTVTDSKGCHVIAMYTIEQPEPLVINEIQTNTSCYGTCDGAINLAISGGHPPYTFVWNTGNGSQDLMNLCSGLYVVTVIDDAGCTADATILINSPAQLGIDTIIIINEINGQSNGEIIAGSFIVPGSLYAINNGPFQASNVFTGLPAGNYVVTIKYGDCTIEYEVEVLNIQTEAVNEMHTNFRCYPNPASTYLFADADVQITIDVLDLQGHTIRHNEKSFLHQISLEGIVPGLYLLRISDGSGLAYRKVVVE